MSLTRFLVPGLIAVLSAGCGVFGSDGIFRDRKNDYLLSAESQPLALPAESEAPAIQDYYFVPAIDENSTAEPDYEVPRPMRLAAGDTDNMVKIQSLGKERWILIRQVPSGRAIGHDEVANSRLRDDYAQGVQDAFEILGNAAVIPLVQAVVQVDQA